MRKESKAELGSTARYARHAIAKSPLDISELNIACLQNGQIELTGKVKVPRGHLGEMNVKLEFEILKTNIRASRGVREVYGERVRLP